MTIRPAALLSSMVLGLLFSCATNSPSPNAFIAEAPEPQGVNNMAYRWGSVALRVMADETDRNRPRPPVGARMLALVFIAQFDAWSRYDSAAVPVHLSAERRPTAERTLANKEKAISYAMARIMQVVFPHDSALIADSLRAFGYDPNDRSLDRTTPQGIGNAAAVAVIEARRNDGSNMFGDDPRAPTPYGDWTHYEPVNTVDQLNKIDRWQPKTFTRDDGTKWVPSALAPHWLHVRPFALDSAAQFRSPPPPVMGDPELERQVREVVALQATLSNEQKALVEFMRDGPRSVQQAGHWLVFARDVSVRDSYTLDKDVQLYFLVTATAMDCFIAGWETKYFYDNSRPYQQVHHLMGKQTITAWAGPNKGMQQMKGSEWRPYSPDAFLCPPFPAYVSGHSCVSGGCSKALELFTGSDHYGKEVRLLPGWLTEPGITQDSITLRFPTFSSAAEQAGISRVLGGYHIMVDNTEGLSMGRSVARVVYDKCSAHIRGTAAH
jgi:hypothetical protein